MNYYSSSFWAPSDYLMHHGILGQKWGVRRYQNADGTLTAAGKKRYGTVENYEKAKAAASAKKENRKKAREERKAKRAKAREERKEAMALEYKKQAEEEAIKEKLVSKLDDRLDRGEISRKEYDRLIDDMDLMDIDEIKALSDEVTHQQRSEMAKRYLKDYQFTKEKASDSFGSSFSDSGKDWSNSFFDYYDDYYDW